MQVFLCNGVIPRIGFHRQLEFFTSKHFQRTFRLQDCLVFVIRHRTERNGRRRKFLHRTGYGYVDGFANTLLVGNGNTSVTSFQTDQLTILHVNNGRRQRTPREVGNICVAFEIQRNLMRFVDIQGDIRRVIANGQLRIPFNRKGIGKHIRIRLLKVKRIQAVVQGIVVHLNVQLRAVLFIDVGNIQGNRRLACANCVTNRGNVFGCKLQHVLYSNAIFQGTVLRQIAKHYGLGIMVIINVKVEINLLFSLVVFRVVLVTDTRFF